MPASSYGGSFTESVSQSRKNEEWRNRREHTEAVHKKTKIWRPSRFALRRTPYERPYHPTNQERLQKEKEKKKPHGTRAIPGPCDDRTQPWEPRKSSNDDHNEGKDFVHVVEMSRSITRVLAFQHALRVRGVVPAWRGSGAPFSQVRVPFRQAL